MCDQRMFVNKMIPFSDLVNETYLELDIAAGRINTNSINVNNHPMVLGDLHDVNLSGLTGGNVLQYNSGTGFWIPGTGGGSGGTVTSVTVSAPLSSTQNPITTSATLSLANSGVAAGNYTNTNLTVDAFGRITSASNGSSSGEPFPDNVALVENSVDTTKLLILSAANVPTATTNTYQVPVASDTLVGRASSDVLTNKTINGATNTVSANALKTTTGTTGTDVQVNTSVPSGSGQALVTTSTTNATWQSVALVPINSAFRYQSVGQTVNGSDVTVLFATKLYDQNNDISGSIFNVPTTGVYEFTANLTIQNPSSTSVIISIVSTAQGIIASWAGNPNALSESAGNSTSVNLSGNIRLASGDSVKVVMYTNAANVVVTNLTNQASLFAGALVRVS